LRDGQEVSPARSISELVLAQIGCAGCVVLLALGGPAYAVLQLYWRMEAAERALRNERLRRSRLEQEVQQLAADLAEARRGTMQADVAAAAASQHPRVAETAGVERPSERA
jgi:hypothetical protein